MRKIKPVKRSTQCKNTCSVCKGSGLPSMRTEEGREQSGERVRRHSKLSLSLPRFFPPDQELSLNCSIRCVFSFQNYPQPLRAQARFTLSLVSSGKRLSTNSPAIDCSKPSTPYILDLAFAQMPIDQQAPFRATGDGRALTARPQHCHLGTAAEVMVGTVMAACTFCLMENSESRNAKSRCF